MVFTIGSMRATRRHRTGARALGTADRVAALPGMRAVVRRRTRLALCALVAEYTARCGWAVVPGVRAERDGACSCGDRACKEQGRHPVDPEVEVPAGAGLRQAAEVWERMPGASVLLPVGRTFDVIDLAEAPGRLALARLERMGLRLGPVLLTPSGRAQFFVAPGAAAELPYLLYRMGWDDAHLDLRCMGRGEHVAAPPSEVAGLGPVGWLREPFLEAVPQPPEARLLLGTLAYVTHRDHRDRQRERAYV